MADSKLQQGCNGKEPQPVWTWAPEERPVMEPPARKQRGSHGMSGTPTWTSWWAMIQRCTYHGHDTYRFTRSTGVETRNCRRCRDKGSERYEHKEGANARTRAKLRRDAFRDQGLCVNGCMLATHGTRCARCALSHRLGITKARQHPDWATAPVRPADVKREQRMKDDPWSFPVKG
jgi:hypothetical protein